ncbi:acyl-CoA dehydrogenase family protein [Acidocella aromatica]|uniref:Putative acyl-CoA dehydrogenase n=1 Tax=Acidocella aromatica TaxID=1303579 RepID=A0A840VCI4_9PROT|nr:acyl-CoA dehydrogenase family protein [Acidocella aromatica]MBB5373374.1 putative acyl-CoA dehydrogenase [Acidocella aromatica]
MSGYATHEVRNQPPPLEDFNAWAADLPLREAVTAFGAGWAEARLATCGARVGSAHVQALARLANRFTPELRTHDRYGHRIDEVEFHPAWHELLGMLRADEVHSLGWTEPRPGAQVARAALSYLWAQGEAGIGCPAAMTFASMAALRHAPDLLDRFQVKILSPLYDPRALPPAQKPALTVAMAMTEKQGGSDLRQIQTQAAPAGGGWYALTGHKWFFSVPTADLFLTLARTKAGPTCFLAQGWRDGGGRNFLLLQRLKEKCGNRSNASSEVEFRGLQAQPIGEEGRGIATILEMAHLTRLECALGSAGLMRQALRLALHHANHRTAFGRPLVEQPAMTNVLADLALEAEAAMWLALRAAAALDASSRDEGERILSRLLAPLAKYWVCKRAPVAVAEALECHGGNGFIEEHDIARLYRDAPLNGLWEGSGNIICLDVMRALARVPDSADLLRAEITRARGAHPALDAWLATPLPAPEEKNARLLTEQLALALAASLLLRHAPSYIAAAYCATRLGHAGGYAPGTLPAGIDCAPIVSRAAPAGMGDAHLEKRG